MNNPFAVVTTTFSKNVQDMRFKLALNMVSSIVQRFGTGPIIVDDSPAEVKDALRAIGGQVFDQEPGTGMGAARRQAVKVALEQGAETIVWMEPEKHPLVTFLDQLVDQFDFDRADLLIPRRRSLRSYPTYQMVKELEGNHEAGSLTRRPDLDLWFGPRVMNRRAARLMVDYDGQYGDRWDSIFIPVLMALKRNYTVVGHTVDYVHPPEQTAAESDPSMDRKRDEQLVTLLDGMSQYWMNK